MIDCKQAAGYLTAYVDNELRGEEIQLLLDHLELCPECREEVTFEREAKELVAKLHRPAMAPARLRGKIVSEVARCRMTDLSSLTSFLKPFVIPLIILVLGLAIIALVFSGASSEDAKPRETIERRDNEVLGAHGATMGIGR